MRLLITFFISTILNSCCCWERRAVPNETPLSRILKDLPTPDSVYHFTGAQDELESCIDLVMRQQTPTNAISVCISDGKFDLQQDKTYIFNYMIDEILPRIGIIRKFEWVDVDLNPVKTALKSHESVLGTYVSKHKLLIDDKGRIGYYVGPELLEKLKSASSSLKLIPVANNDIDNDYTLSILGMHVGDGVTLDADNNALYLDYAFTVISPDCAHIITWKNDEDIIDNTVLKVQGNSLIEIKPHKAKDLRKKWKCDIGDIEGLKNLFPDPYSDDAKDPWILELSDKYFIYQSKPGEYFSNLPAGRSRDFHHMEKVVRFTIKDGVIKWIFTGKENLI